MNSLKNAERGGAEPDGVGSLLDTDLYKLTMQCAVLKFYSKTSVSSDAVFGGVCADQDQTSLIHSRTVPLI